MIMRENVPLSSLIFPLLISLQLGAHLLLLMNESGISLVSCAQYPFVFVCLFVCFYAYEEDFGFHFWFRSCLPLLRVHSTFSLRFGKDNPLLYIIDPHPPFLSKTVSLLVFFHLLLSTKTKNQTPKKTTNKPN